MRAKEIAEARERAVAERLEAERCRQAAEAEKARRARLKILKQRGASSVWRGSSRKSSAATRPAMMTP